MIEIAAFVSGCLFTVLLGWLVYRTVRSLVDYQEDTIVRRKEKSRQAMKKIAPVPDGGVISPKTLDELAMENDQGVRAAEELLDRLYQGKE